MKRLLVFLALLFGVSSIQPQEPASKPSSPLDAASAELVTLTNAWTDAINAKDHTKLEVLMAPEFALYAWKGEVWAHGRGWIISTTQVAAASSFSARLD
jgi:hypothetical protein